MSIARKYRSQGGPFCSDYMSSSNGNHSVTTTTVSNNSNYHYYNTCSNHPKNQINVQDAPKMLGEHNYNYSRAKPEVVPSVKRRKFSASAWESSGRPYVQPNTYIYESSTCFNSSILPAPTRSYANEYTPASSKRNRTNFEGGVDMVFMSRDEIERYSPSRKDGIDIVRERHLRYSYCTFLQNLGIRLELPQATIGTAMVLCHRFFVRRSHACHDRFLIATAALFLAAKSEETPCPLNNVLTTSSEILHKQNLTCLSYLLPIDWFEQYRERVIEAEQMILTTLNFELNVQHPYAPLASILDKLGFSQSILLNVALSLVSEGLRSSLWLQFKPHQIAAGAAYLATKFLNLDPTTYENVWQEFETPPSVIKDVTQQLMELF